MPVRRACFPSALSRIFGYRGKYHVGEDADDEDYIVVDGHLFSVAEAVDEQQEQVRDDREDERDGRDLFMTTKLGLVRPTLRLLG